MVNKNYVNAFNSFNSGIEVDIKHSGTQGNTITVYDAAEWLEWDESGAEEAWSNHLDSEGLEISCSLENAINENFPELEVNVTFSLEFEGGNSAFQDDNSINEIKRILQKTIEKLEKSDPNDEYISESIKDMNGNNIGDLHLAIGAE